MGVLLSAFLGGMMGSTAAAGTAAATAGTLASAVATAGAVVGAAGVAGGIATSAMALSQGGGKKELDAQGNPISTGDKSTGALSSTPSLEDQATQRRLARLSKYFTTPTGILDGSTGSAGVF